MGTQEKHGNYSCDDSFEEIGDQMVKNLGLGCYFRQDSQERLSEEVTFKLGLKKQQQQRPQLLSRGRTI